MFEKRRNNRKAKAAAQAGTRQSRHSHKHRAQGGNPRNLIEVEGKVSLTREGIGFVTVEGMEDDIFIPVRRMKGALHGDTVRAAIPKTKREGARHIEGEIRAVIERSSHPHIGVLITRGDRVWAIVESRTMPYDISIPVKNPDELPTIGGMKAGDGMKVAVLVTDWPRKSAEPVGRIVDVLGYPGENETEMHSILAQYNLPYRFDPEIEKAAEDIPDIITAEDLEGRRDMRGVTTFTIDPTDAKDFDDALSFRILENGNYEVGVHIADVTHYVTPDSALDNEAYNRATSVYLVDRTVPMLPEALSNKICSLRPHEDKLTFSAVFELNDKAKVTGSWFGRTVINSDCRFDYETVQEIILGKEDPLRDDILKLNALASVLRKQRFAKGAVNFERPEIKVIVDNDGRPVDVVQRISNESHWLIEEFMLLANRSVAEFVAKKCKARNPTFVYRIHDNPNPDKIEELRRFAHNFGHELGATEEPKDVSKRLNSIMKSVKGLPEENAIQMMALRSMARACYSTDNIGHYGLAFKYYTHFTSPIRRYPDMMVHRLLTTYMNGGKSQDKLFYEECCKHASQMEQTATEAERASIKYKLVEFMQDKVGREFDGTISGLTEWGIYVEIEPTKIEGMVALREITEDFLQFDQDNYRTVAKGSGKVFNLGDKVRIRVLRANLDQKLLDYKLIWQ